MASRPVHLWVYNHPFHGISDQVEFFVSIMKQHGYAASVGARPRLDAMNVVIEKFTQETTPPLIEFCQSTGKRVAVIMTEHIDFIDDNIFFHGIRFGAPNDYLFPSAQNMRLKCLMACSQYIRCILVLGDLPELRNFSRMMPDVSVRVLPFPRIAASDPARSSKRPTPKITHDLVFTGFSTEHRRTLLGQLEKEMSVLTSTTWVSRRVRDKLNFSARIVLNLPQRQSWRWLSLMRVIGALRCGRATVSLGTNDNTKISACCTQLDIGKAGWLERMRSFVNNWPEEHQRALERYTAMANQFDQASPFPHDAFEIWQITENFHGKLGFASMAA